MVAIAQEGSLGGPGGIGGVTAGGAAVLGGQVTVTAEMLQALEHLVRLGAIGNVVISSSGVGTGAGAINAPGVVLMETPSGTIVPRRGPFAERTVRYGDPRNKHTKVASSSLDDILEAIKDPRRARGALADFARAMREKSATKNYGSQLSKEGVTQYEALVRACLEGGGGAGNAPCVAPEPIGIDAVSGKPTPMYRVDGAPHGAHIIPLKPR